MIGLSIIYFTMYFLNSSVVVANACGYFVGVLLGFALNKFWTFGCDRNILPSFLRYLLVLAVAYLANLITVLFANMSFGINVYVSQALGIIPYTIIGYIGSRYFVFRGQRL